MSCCVAVSSFLLAPILYDRCNNNNNFSCDYLDQKPIINFQTLETLVIPPLIFIEMSRSEGKFSIEVVSTPSTILQKLSLHSVNAVETDIRMDVDHGASGGGAHSKQTPEIAEFSDSCLDSPVTSKITAAGEVTDRNTQKQLSLKQQQIADIFAKKVVTPVDSQQQPTKTNKKNNKNRDQLKLNVAGCVGLNKLNDMSSPKRTRSRSKEDASALVSPKRFATSKEVPIAKIKADAASLDEQGLQGGLSAFLTQLIGQLEDQREKSNRVIDDLLDNKTAVSEAQAQADRAVQVAEDAHIRVDRSQMDTLLLEDKIERMSRSNDVVIRGLPLIGDENSSSLLQFVDKIAAAIGVSLTRRDVDFVRVLYSHAEGKREPRMLLVRFATHAVRREFFSNYLGVKDGLRASCIGRHSDERIYISDNLTGHNAAIRRQAYVLCKSGSIGSHSVRDGVVYITEVGKTDRQPVRTLSDLAKLMQADARPRGSGPRNAYQNTRGSHPRGRGGRGNGHSASRGGFNRH